MLQLTPDQMRILRDWFVPDRPGPMVGLHVLQTGNGACFVDRWPSPRVALADSAGNFSLVGDLDALNAEDLKNRIIGFVEAPERFVPLLRTAFPGMNVWDRMIFELNAAPKLSIPAEQVIRRLVPADVFHLWGLSPEINWICNTWGGPAGLAASGRAWGAFADDRLVSVACTFYVGERYEDIGVVTEKESRGLGLSVACAGKLCEDIQSRGRRPSWTTSPDNTASQRVAEKLGFSLQRRDFLYVIGAPIPKPARRQ